MPHPPATVAVFVQGDLLQSPRMLNHVSALQGAGCRVHLVGYAAPGEPLPLSPGIRVWRLAGAGTRRWPRLPRLLYLPAAAWRAAHLALRLRGQVRAALTGADAALVQMPPPLPLTWLVLRAARRRGIPVVLDWHNYSFAVLALRLGDGHWLVRLVRWVESRLGRRAAGQLCVSPQMADDLQRRWTLRAAVLPDRPRGCTPAAPGPESRRTVLTRVVASLGGSAPAPGPLPLVVVSPTSWGLDEAMDLLLEALARPACPRPLLVLATGRGPGRRAFAERALSLSGDGLQVLTGWLEDDDYRRLLAAADVGVSLHHSASGVDFPMKIVDMLEAGLPVLALDYGRALRAGLPPPPAARRFRDADELADRLAELAPARQRDAARAGVYSARAAGPWAETWDARWRQAALPLLRRPADDAA